MTQADLYRFLNGCRLAVLSSTNEDHSPQSALIGIAVTPDLEIVFDTVKRSRKYPNLRKHAACSLVIGWSGEQTVQYEGTARELGEAERDGFHSIYFQAWPECRSHLAWSDIVYFVVQPRWMRFSDYERDPPLIQEFEFECASSAGAEFPS